MATLNLKDAVKSGINNEFLKSRFVMRGLKQVFGKSSNDNPMITWDTEIIQGPDGTSIVENSKGEKIDVGGVRVRFFITLSEKNLGNIRDFFMKMGRDDIANMDNFDPENPPDMKWLEGITFEAIGESVPRIVRQRSKVRGQLGEPMKDARGNDIVNGYEVNFQLQDILGMCNVEINRPY